MDGYLYYPFNFMGSNNRKKRKPHKSLITTSSTYHYDGVDYEVDARGQGIYKRILKKTIEQLTIATLEVATLKRAMKRLADLENVLCNG